MEVLKGTAAGVRYTVHVSGDKDGVSTRHHAMFKLGSTTVMFDAGAPPVIGEGDRLVVAGRMKGRVLLCDAYLNQTACVRGDTGLWGGGDGGRARRAGRGLPREGAAARPEP